MRTGPFVPRFRHLAAGLILALAMTACTADPEVSTAGDPATSGLASDAGSAAGTCLAGDPNCDDLGDGGQAAPLDELVLDDVLADPEGPVAVSMGGHLFIDDSGPRLCGSLLESFPPQCGSVIIEIVASTSDVLEFAAEAFGNPDDAVIQNSGGVWWTNEWVNIPGLLEGGKLVIDD